MDDKKESKKKSKKVSKKVSAEKSGPKGSSKGAGKESVKKAVKKDSSRKKKKPDIDSAAIEDKTKAKEKPASSGEKGSKRSKKTDIRKNEKVKRSKKNGGNLDERQLKKNEETEDDEIDTKALERGDVPMNVVGHLDELRSRLLVSMITIISITLVSFFMSEHLLDIINRPFLSTGRQLNVFNLTEGFIIRLKASLIAGILIGIPVIFYEIWKYILPAINLKDRSFIRLSIMGAIFLFYAGISFTYFFVLPFAIKMLLGFTPIDMTNTIGASKYLSFVMIFSLGMGIMFELPIVIMILTRIGLISPALLIRKRKYAIILIWIIAAMITPPDALTQLMLAMPIMLLYELSILISKITIKRKQRELRKEHKK